MDRAPSPPPQRVLEMLESLLRLPAGDLKATLSHRRSLFERFVTGREGGLGLGLYLAKRIAALHGGELKAESIPGAGARFTLSLPAVPESAAAPRGAPSASLPG